jgi:hypothetical protein
MAGTSTALSHEKQNMQLGLCEELKTHMVHLDLQGISGSQEVGLLEPRHDPGLGSYLSASRCLSLSFFWNLSAVTESILFSTSPSLDLQSYLHSPHFPYCC